MLSNVKDTIESVRNSNTNFYEHYKHFILNVQDRNIEQEVKSYLKYNMNDIACTSRKIDRTHRALLGMLNVKFS